MHRIFMIVCGLLIAGLVAACAPITAPTPGPVSVTETPLATPEIAAPETATPEPEEETGDDPSAEPAEFEGPMASIADNVRQYLAAEHDAEANEIDIIAMEAVDWPDGCLGAPEDDEMCIMVITPGYRVTALVDGEEVTVHTNADGTLIRPAPNGEVRTASGSDAVGGNAMGEEISMTIRQTLMQQLHTNFDDITITSVEATEFSDACLGVSNPAELCAQMITPGYIVVLEAEGQEYIYHTDATGQNVRLASAPEARTGHVLIFWTGQDNGECREATIGTEGVAFGRCYDRQMQGYLAGEERMNDLEEFAATYAPFHAETTAGYIEFSGTGDQVATPQEQRMIAEWAQLVALEAEAGRSGASWGLAFSWGREGGIAGFCDNLVVYVTGHLHAAQCEGETYTTIGQRRLDAEELAKVYGWIEEFNNFEMDVTDPATADAMTTRVTFSGTGTTEADESTQQEIAEFASDLFNTLQP